MGTTNFDAVAATTFTGALVGAVTGNVTGDVTGNLTGNVTGNVTGQVSYTAVARTATADGTGTGTIAAAGMIQFVTVTCDQADKIIILPAPTPGVIVILRNGGTGYELRTSAPGTVAINGGAEANAESAIAASTMVVAVCTTATTWQAISLAATTLAAVEAAAAGA